MTKKQLIKKSAIVFVILCCLLSCSVFRKKNEGKPRVIDFFITNKKGAKITTLSPDDKVIYLVILSENMKGQIADLELDEEEIETGYIYKGQFLNKKVSFKIRNNKEKLKLRIYNPDNKRHRRLKKKAMANKK